MLEAKLSDKIAEEKLSQRKEGLQEKLKSISKNESNCYYVKGVCGNDMQVLTVYNTNKYLFSPGDFITADFISKDAIALCVGLSYGCREEKCELKEDVVWFLPEKYSGITSFAPERLAECSKI